MQKIDPSKHKLLYGCIKLFCGTLFRLFGPFQVVGHENIPKSGPVIISSNHISYIDPPALGVAVKRRLRYMAKAELFKPGLPEWLLLRLGAFPVKRGEVDRESIRTALEALAAGEGIIVFPEGTRSSDGKLSPANAGVAMLAKRSGAYVVPACVMGTDKMLPSHAKHFKRATLRIAFGRPFRYEDFEVPEGKDRKTLFGEKLMLEIQRLLKENGVDAPFQETEPEKVLSQ